MELLAGGGVGAVPDALVELFQGVPLGEGAAELDRVVLALVECVEAVHALIEPVLEPAGQAGQQPLLAVAEGGQVEIGVQQVLGIEERRLRLVSPDMGPQDFEDIYQFIEENEFEYPVAIPLTPLSAVINTEKLETLGEIESIDAPLDTSSSSAASRSSSTAWVGFMMRV